MESAVLPDPAKVCLTNADPGKTRWYGTEVSPRNHNVAFAEPQQHVINPANLGRALDDCIKHRLHVRGRSADDAEYFGSCSLMLQSLAQFCVPFLDLFEEPDIFDGNHRLIGEGFEERDLLVSERSDLGPTNMNRPNGSSLSHQRGRKAGTSAGNVLNSLGIRKLFTNFRRNVRHVNRFPVKNGSAHHESRADGSRRLRYWHRPIYSHCHA